MQEALCRAAITAIAGGAGVNILFGRAFDYGVDCSIRPVQIDRRGQLRRAENGVALDIQLKATIRWRETEAGILHSLENKAWNDMVGRPAAGIPLVVGLLCMPREEDAWLRCGENELSIGGCCYFVVGAGERRQPESGRQQIVIPKADLLDPEGLRGLVRMAGVRLGVTDAA